MNVFTLGFNGERQDPASGTTHLGNGYRAYNPVLMRFHSPDSLSPFGDGGMNACVYCAADPVNRADPSGHHSVAGWVGICLGVAMSVLLTPVSGGSSLAVALSVVSVASAAVSTGLAVAQQFVEGAAPNTGAALGWAALGVGIASAVSAIALSRVAFGAKSLVSLLKGSSNRPFGGLMMSCEGFAASPRGQFRNAAFIGVYPSVEPPGNLLAFSFEDGPRDAERMTIVGQPAITHRGHFALGSGQWTLSGRYKRSLLGAVKINNLIRVALENNQNLREIRLAIPYSSKMMRFNFASFTSRIRALLPRHLTIDGALESFEVRGEAVEKLSDLQNSLHLNALNQLVTYNEMVFSPDLAQFAMDQLSEEYAEREGAFEFVGASWH